MLGFKSFHCASILLAGIELIHMIANLSGRSRDRRLCLEIVDLSMPAPSLKVISKGGLRASVRSLPGRFTKLARRFTFATLTSVLSTA
jgi:hypothetical protein